MRARAMSVFGGGSGDADSDADQDDVELMSGMTCCERAEARIHTTSPARLWCAIFGLALALVAVIVALAVVAARPSQITVPLPPFVSGGNATAPSA